MTPTEVYFKTISKGEQEMLERLGVMKVTDKHIEFISLISEYLEQRKNIFSDNEIKDWL